MNKKKIIFGMLFLTGILLAVNVSAYLSSNYDYSQGLGGSGGWVADTSMCEAGQDFVIQIAPFGCEPAVVRSDLLEEQNYPVFCQLAATKINPLIKVEAIESISFSGEYPDEISGIGFHPAKAALGVSGDLNSPVLNNIGYVVIVLKQQQNESSMPDFVQGNLTAMIKYDIENAYGIGKATFYLPELDDLDWESRKVQYGFWKGRGYLKTEGVGVNGASVSVYDGESKKISSVSLEKGETSDEIYLPGFDCLAGLRLTLDSLEAPDTRAKLDINGQIVEVAKGEVFLEGRCEIKDVDKKGLVEVVRINCREDEAGLFGGKSFELTISPKLELIIDGKKDAYNVGDYLYDLGDKRVYLGYVNTLGNTNKEENLYLHFIAIPAPTTKDKLTSEEILSLARYDKGWVNQRGADSVAGLGKWIIGKIGSASINLGKWAINGENIRMLSYEDEKENILGKDVQLLGFAGPEDSGIPMVTVEEIYTLRANDEEGSDLIDEEGKDIGLDLRVDDGVYNLYRGNTKLGHFDLRGKEEQQFYFTITNKGTNDDFFKELVSINLDNSEIKITLRRKVSREGTSEETKFLSNYNLAVQDYDKIIESFSGEKVPDGFNEISAGEEALYSKIKLAYRVGQRKTAAELCDEFKERYPDSEKKDMKEFCDENYKLSSTGISTTDVMINNEIREISFEGIYEPSFDDYGATIAIEGTGGKRNEISLTLNQIYYLDELRNDKEAIYSSYRDTGKLAYILRFSFVSEEWLWTIDGKNWVSVSDKKIPEESYVYATGKGFLPKDLELNENDALLLEKLKASTLKSGKGLLDEEGFARSIGEEYIQLVKLDDDSAELVYNLRPKGFWSTIKTITISNDKGELKEDTPESFGSDFIFTLVDINLKKSAKVSVIPTINNAGSETEFLFKVGIEKRAIQLSPEKIREKIKNLEDSIADWEKKSETLGSVVKGLKTACLATGTYLIVKNFLSNAGGKSIARMNVMRSEGGWNDKCSKMVNQGTYSTLNECYTKEADNINKEVDEYYEKLEKQNEEIKLLQKNYEDKNWWGEKIIDTDEFKKEYCEKVKKELNDGAGSRKVSITGGNTKTVSEILDKMVNNCEGVTIEQLRSLQLNARIGSGATLTQLDKDLKKVYGNVEDIAEEKNFAERTGFTEAHVTSFEKIKKEIQFSKDVKFSSIEEKYSFTSKTISPDSYVQNYKDSTSGKEYILVLDKDNVVTGTYEITGISEGKNLLEKYEGSDENNKGNPLKLIFKKYDAKTYENPYTNSISDPKKPVLRYYETEPYAKMPALVPFDLEHGWYASVKQTLPVGSNIQTYDKSGKVTSFYVCNVGENNKEENTEGDDICQQINTGTGQPYNQFYGLDKSGASKIVTCAVDAIEDASKQYGSSSVRIKTDCGGEIKLYVGEPAVDIPDIQCQDIMSPTECKWLFNVCDPVICPSSRCNLGGAYHVKDVIQQGIIGSIVLCLPNIREGIYIPICLSGVKAGIDGYLSMLKSYRGCLQESLDTGKTVGICDELHSIYLCELFWKESLPLAEIAIPKITEWMLGQNVHGGGEYLGVQSAWENAEKSADYFTQYYASSSFEAFKSQAVEQIGSEVCQNYASAVYPEGGNLLDSLTEPDSPPQYHGRFDEIPFTTTTSPPMSQYKVYYHIYAGEESRAYYQVYLKGAPESSFYQDTSSKKIVASGYIPAGGYASDTPDFVAPSGYKQMCIVVNGQEECGFEEVSTSFAVNYVEDKYLQEQASATDIKTESECISGSASLYSILNPNIQSAAEEILNPAIYENGIIRICATNNPGVGTDPDAEGEGSRWIDVGYCDNENMRCWLDMDSVREVIENLNIENETLNYLSNRSLKVLISEGDYNTTEEINSFIDEIQDKGSEEKIKRITSVLDKVFWNSQKVRLLLIRGDAYGKLAKAVWGEESAKKIATIETEEEAGDECSLDICNLLIVGGEDLKFNVAKKISDEKCLEDYPSENTKYIYDKNCCCAVVESEGEYCTKHACSKATSTSSALDVVGGKCHEEIGERIIEIAKEFKKDKGIDDAKVKSDTGAENFECLVLQLAMQESCLAHCVYKENQEDYNYCDNTPDFVVKGDNDNSIGVMQININAHPAMKEKAYEFEENVEYGINYLIQNYAETSKSYSCKGVNYKGWELALRRYNGWFPDDCSKGDKDYVDHVEGRKDEIQSLFPEECGEKSAAKIRSGVIDEIYFDWDGTKITEMPQNADVTIIIKDEDNCDYIRFKVFDSSNDYELGAFSDKEDAEAFLRDIEHEKEEIYYILIDCYKNGEFTSKKSPDLTITDKMAAEGH